MIKKLLIKHKEHYTDRAFFLSVLIGIFLLFVSFVINFYAGIYATISASNAVTDLILNNIRVFNVGIFFHHGPFVFWAIVVILCIREPKYIPFILKSVATLLIIRSIFISLTHIGQFPTQISPTDSEIFRFFSFGGDLFFSAHTAFPFLLALEFWGHRYMRYIFLLASIGFGAVVLMAHVHYSIDVLSAFFITYSVFSLCRYLFKRDWKTFQFGLKG
ncbi:MAG: hypothetical protein A3A33_02250 [Candidatus Yanofskybacteria bacterium RIFCSPLOWO2_01_FULL_49_25]|uniref:Sphingomyelin synthase-like domain-containing protein n=1 Tax=Candidatus Yanofskybacteria bacterium RIFCSPLOWO2_01_FULL_49_25 TaxID=1802701 RepID=A0A1F8GS06_9BACT|nr:MAG: hypothetical protein A3A33_02250 [Candidatus Yanofskybacteria bacterium RIFCSPLOWO2_01_FULL_49_25]